MKFTEIDREDFRNLLHEISEAYMPFGKYGPEKYPPCGVPLTDLPPEYYSWLTGTGRKSEVNRRMKQGRKRV